MQQVFLKVQRPAELQSVRLLRHLFEQVAQKIALDNALKNNFLLAISELATNSIEHATPTATQIELTFMRTSDHWQLEIADNGGAITKLEEILTEKKAIMETAPLLENGMGLTLVCNMFPNFHYQPKSADYPYNRFILRHEYQETPPKKSILLVEDDNALAAVLGLYLEEQYHVDHVIHGKAALQHLKRKSVDLILSDIEMPEMDGLTLRHHLSKTPRTATIPFIFLTGQKKFQLEERATALGIDDYLIKPIDKAPLLKIIRRVLQRVHFLKQQFGNRLDHQIRNNLITPLPEQRHGFNMVIQSQSYAAGGGDFFYHTADKSSNKSPLLILGDVMGHDEQAKFFSHLHAGYLSGLLRGLNDQSYPKTLLQHFSQALFHDHLLGATLVTTQAVQLQQNGQVILASAGHPPPLHITKTGCHELSLSGTLPGLIANADYKQITLPLKIGERLLLYTDGLFEITPRDKNNLAQHRQKVIDLLLDQQKEPLLTVAQNIMLLCQERIADDITLLILERSQAPETA
ncbi:SpoIIE family protein phosphatase [Magnetococcales bacterium HHB-1]